MKISNLFKLLAVVFSLVFIVGCPLIESEVRVQPASNSEPSQVNVDINVDVGVEDEGEAGVDELVSEDGRLVIYRDPIFSSGSSNALVMGVQEVVLVKYYIANNTEQNVDIMGVTLSHYFSDENGEEFGQSLSKAFFCYSNIYGDPKLDEAFSVEGEFNFSGFSMPISSGSRVAFYVQVDISSYLEGAVSGSQHQITWQKFLDDGSLSIKAFGESSGLYLNEDEIFFREDGYIASQDFFVYRTKVIANWAADTPSGAAVGGDDSVVGKVKIYNSANAGSYEAIIKGIDLKISSSFDPGAFEVKVYREHQFSASRVFRADFDLGGDLNSTISLIFDQAVSATDGGTETFIITMDTYAAGVNDSLAIRPVGIYWSDGVSGIHQDPDMDWQVLAY